MTVNYVFQSSCVFASTQLLAESHTVQSERLQTNKIQEGHGCARV